MPNKNIYDDNGNIIGVLPPTKIYDDNGDEIQSSTKAIDYEKAKFQTGPQLKSDTEYGYLKRAFIHALPGVLGGMGGVAGGVPGAAIGGGIGSLIENLPSIMQGNIKEATPNVLGEAALQGGFQGAAPIIGAGLSRAGSAIGQRLSSFPIRDLAGDVPSIVRTGVPASVGQVTGSPFAQFFERNLGPAKTKIALGHEQQDFMSDLAHQLRIKFTQPEKILPQRARGAIPDVEEIGQAAQKAIKSNFREVQRDVTQLYGQVKFDAERAQQTFQRKTGEVPAGWNAQGQFEAAKPIFEGVTVKGPIDYSPVAQSLKTVKPELDKLIEGLPQDTPGKWRLNQFKKVVDDLVTPKIDAQGNEVYISDWSVIKQFRTQVNDALNKKIFGDLKYEESGLKKIADSLGPVIEDSVKNLWEPAAPGALRRLQEANEANIIKKEIFNPRVRKEVYGSRANPADASQIFNTARDNPEAAGEMIKALSPEGQREIRSQFYEDIIKKSPESALEALKSPQYKKVFSSSDRADLADFFRATRRVKPEDSHLGSYSVARVAAYTGIGLGVGGGEYLMNDKSFPVYSLAGATFLFGGRQFAKNVLLNPRFARAASRLARLDPDANESKFLRKTILTAMRGTEFTLKLANGDEQKAKVTQEGKIQVRPDQSLAQAEE